MTLSHRHPRTQRASVLGPRPRLHGHVRLLRRPRRRRVDRHHPSRPRPGRHFPRHRRHVRPVHATRSWSAGRSRAGATRSCWPPSSASCATADGSLRGVNGRPEYVRAAVRGQPAAPRRRPIDLYYQHRVDPDDADRGHRRRHGRAGAAGQGPLSSACPRPRPTRSAAPHAVHPIAALQTEYSLWSRDPEDEILPTVPRAGHRLRRLQPARPRLPHRPDQALRRPRRRRLPPPLTRASRARTSRSNLDLVERVRGDRGARRAARRRSWRWPGCWRRATTSCRSPAPSAASYLEENVGALDVELTPEDLARIDEVAPRAAAGTATPRTPSRRSIGRGG